MKNISATNGTNRTAILRMADRSTVDGAGVPMVTPTVLKGMRCRVERFHPLSPQLRAE